MTIYRGPGGTGTATSDADTSEFQEFLTQSQAARDAALVAETAAELAETNAETAAASASSSASAASASASSASTSASSSSTNAAAAASSASSASTSASAAAASASSAAATLASSVQLTGNQTIAGTKTFSTRPVLSSAAVDFSVQPTPTTLATGTTLTSAQLLTGLIVCNSGFTITLPSATDLYSNMPQFDNISFDFYVIALASTVTINNGTNWDSAVGNNQVSNTTDRAAHFRVVYTTSTSKAKLYRLA